MIFDALQIIHNGHQTQNYEDSKTRTALKFCKDKFVNYGLVMQFSILVQILSHFRVTVSILVLFLNFKFCSCNFSFFFLLSRFSRSSVRPKFESNSLLYSIQVEILVNKILYFLEHLSLHSLWDLINVRILEQTPKHLVDSESSRLPASTDVFPSVFHRCFSSVLLNAKVVLESQFALV